MTMSEAGLESTCADKRGISGLFHSKRKKCDTLSCSDRGKKAGVNQNVAS